MKQLPGSRFPVGIAVFLLLNSRKVVHWWGNLSIVPVPRRDIFSLYGSNLQLEDNRSKSNTGGPLIMQATKLLLSRILILLIALSAAPAALQAACSRADVEFYLDKGFSHEQITAICSQAEAPKPETSAFEPENVKPHRQSPSATKKTTRKENPPRQRFTDLPEHEKTLLTAIKGKNVTVNDDHIAYTLERCIDYGENDLFGFKNTACVKERFTIGLQNLEIIESGKKFIFLGRGEIRVRGNIRRDILSGLEKLKGKDRILVEKKLESGNETVIPVRDEFSLERIRAILRDLVAEK